MDDRVLDAMLPFLRDQFGNPSSTHKFGLKINRAVNEARQKVAELINANTRELIFTSGATEAINLALKGIALAPGNTKRHIVTVKTEHKAVLDTCKYLETLGFEITYLPVQSNGLIDKDLFRHSLKTDTLLACVMLVNNETGVIQDVKALGEICKSSGIIFMSDTTQAVGKIPVDVQELGIDIMAFSGHKFYAPKGIGALYLSKEMQRLSHSQPLIHGGGHENGYRSGTLNVPAIIGLGKACEIAADEMNENSTRIMILRNMLETELLKIEGSFINGDRQNRIFNTSNICFPGIDANILIGQLGNIALSNGSACTAAIVEPSHVLTSMGLGQDNAFSTIRVSLGKYNTQNEIRLATDEICSIIRKLHSLDQIEN